MTKSTITREQLLEIIETDHVQCGEASYLARMALAAMDSEPVELPLDYLQGHKDGLEWAARLAEANHPDTGDWLYDDPIELAKAIRKGPDMPPVQPVADSEPVAWGRFQETPTDGGYWILYDYKPNCSGVEPLYRHAQPAPERDQVRIAHAEWSQATFGNVGPVGPLKHLSKEALEAAAEPGDLSEWADMQFLLWDAQLRAGITDEQITQAMIDKLAVNKQRSWPEPKDGEPRLHIKEQPAPVVPDERAAFNAWNNDVDCPLAGRDAKSAAWMAWNYRAMLQAGNSPVIPEGWQVEAEKLAEMHGMSFVLFRHGEAPQCADPTKVVISFTDKGLGHDTPPAAPQEVPDGK